VGVPISQVVKLASYVLAQKLRGRQRFPLVLMLEPLFRCNLACAGCGKTQHPPDILRRQLTPEQCLRAVDQCGAPVVSVPGGEPLLHPQIDAIVAGIVARRKYVYLCTNALTLRESLGHFQPSKYLTFSVHIDGSRADHDRLVRRAGVFDTAINAIAAAVTGGFRVTTNTTLFEGANPRAVRHLLDCLMDLGVEGMTISPGYSYSNAPDQDHFLGKAATRKLFHTILSNRRTRWRFNQSALFLEFLMGLRDYACTPWGMPTYNLFGWQKPCYLLGEGYTATFKELMETTNWDSYGTGKYEKCADCMAHCGYEPTAAHAAISNPLKALWVSLRGIRTSGPMAPEISMDRQRPAEYVFSSQVQMKLSEIRSAEAEERAKKTATAA